MHQGILVGERRAAGLLVVVAEVFAKTYGLESHFIALLQNVPLWYELWRQLNGFPPNYYQNEEGKSEEPKLKAPVKSLK